MLLDDDEEAIRPSINSIPSIPKAKLPESINTVVRRSVVLKQTTGIIVGAVTFAEDGYEGRTLQPVSGQAAELTGTSPLKRPRWTGG